MKRQLKVMEKEFINERWAICSTRKDHKNKHKMENIKELYYEDDRESDDENNDEDLSEKSMNRKTKDTILYEWRKQIDGNTNCYVWPGTEGNSSVNEVKQNLA